MLGRINSNYTSSRRLHSSALRLSLQQKQKQLSSHAASVSPRSPHPRHKEKINGKHEQEHAKKETPVKHAPRNELGVQLLSRQLHSQIFKNVIFPSPEPTFVRIAREHLETHGLDPKQGSVLPDTGFALPPLLGDNLDQHFHAIGVEASQPWLDIARALAECDLPPRPDVWDVQPGWTKYCWREDGSSYWVHVDYPELEADEKGMVLDVETMPTHSPYPVLATLATKDAWYSWISPWLLGLSDDPKHILPLGDPNIPRVIVGHNVSYDRARVLEEYSINGTNNRYLDTMSLHVAVKGISSHQRPAWMKYRKSKVEANKLREEAYEAVAGLINDGNGSLSEMLLDEEDVEAEAQREGKRWEDLTSANSLADVARLHCGIEIDKEVRNDFMTRTREEILENVQDYLSYCGNDVGVTHEVFRKVLPEFLGRCPHPVSFAGMMGMGSAFLTVDEGWEEYIQSAEGKYRELEERVKGRLVQLAREAKEMGEGQEWKGDVWLEQLDWSPKVAGKSRGVYPTEVVVPEATEELPEDTNTCLATVDSALPAKIPAWYRQILQEGPLSRSVVNSILPLLLKVTFDGHPLRRDKDIGWHYVLDDQRVHLPTGQKCKVLTPLSKEHGAKELGEGGRMGAHDTRLASAIARGERGLDVETKVREIMERVRKDGEAEADLWLCQLDWKLATFNPEGSKPASVPAKRSKKPAKPPKPAPVYWPQWYWDLTRPRKNMPPGTIDLSVRNRLAPILLHLSWLGWPLFHSREHGWTFRVPRSADFQARAPSLDFYDDADAKLKAMATREGGYVFYKLPHKDGEEANVGSPLGKTFMKYAQDGTLESPGDEAREALDMNAQCSYWISARDRVMSQMVVWQDERHKMGIPVYDLPAGAHKRPKKWGMILPQVVTMGTVTRRAIEKTWLTASNAKKNRVGSELKAMVRAPEGYSIVGADVDSEELWISSVVGDAQFGLHGATAIGWMTLEGTKSAGTDLHSKTASILGISRDQAKVFNYSRIYGAGMKHAVLLLMQASAGMLPEQAHSLAEQLYAQTKGKNTHRQDYFGRKFWYGGTESFVFNKLEEIALSDKPQTPALGCGITHALSKEYLPAGFGTDYMTSRINWVVQSSGVDYLHLLIVSMDHLIKKYKINARYLISVHDELRYLVADEDRYRAALALQIANLWTRCLFAYKLGMDDLPQGVAFFSSIDVDTILRKEVDMPCVTPSQPDPLPPGESLNIHDVLQKTNNGSLWKDGRPMTSDSTRSVVELAGYTEPNCLIHRASSAAWLRAQATTELSEIKLLSKADRRASGSDNINKGKSTVPRRKKKGVGDAASVDWSNLVEEAIRARATA